ncbi:MAG: HAMP domain-containing histidine kinase [Bacteroidales bacterium]|nr:HAMP domain-containing histidine kinase [Bacteroidales bacterium]
MKFLTKINRNYLILFTTILLTVTIAGYFVLHIIIMRGAKERLLGKMYLIEKEIANTGEIPNLYPIIEIQKTSEAPVIKPTFKEVIIRNEMENEDEIFLEYSKKIKVNDSWYLVKLRQSSFENEDLILILALTLFTLLSSAFIISFFITKRMNKTVWADFEHNLHEIESFGLSQNQNISLLETSIEEFQRLNQVINNLTHKLKSDYLMLKEFTENVSHEIQTPLSIALLNLEQILQQDLKEETFQRVVKSINALKRLSALNQSLILLAKIENKQFITDKEISFKELVSRKEKEFSILFEAKKLDIKLLIEQDFIVEMNEQLADILINNLFSNAINHNIVGGDIRIFMNAKTFEICNTGENNLLTDDTIFNRFVSGNPKSYGLGLAIVKKICETSNLNIRYLKNDYHCFIINSKI